MMILTKAQRLALKAVYDRGRSAHQIACGDISGLKCVDCEEVGYFKNDSELLYCHESGECYSRVPSYLAFRRQVCLNTVFQCVFVGWKGMVLGIETDGYTHS